MPTDGSSSKFVNFVTDRFTSIVSVATIDNFIYVADSTEGFFAIESTSDGSYTEPVALPVAFSDKRQELPKPLAMVIFTMKAI